MFKKSMKGIAGTPAQSRLPSDTSPGTIQLQVGQFDDDKTVLGKILTQLDQSGPSDVRSLMETLQLHQNPKGSRRLKSAIADGMIDVTASGDLKVNSFGARMADLLKRDT